MNIAIFGSCVSRDTCEFLPEANVVAYIARQSVTSLQTPYGSDRVNTDVIESPFQRRMVLGDLDGTGTQNIAACEEPIDVVLIDLVDERRGFWRFPDGTSMNNSIEVEQNLLPAGGFDRGTRHVEFGADEHFRDWKQGFGILVDGLRVAGLLDRAIFIDTEWARAVEHAPQPREDWFAAVGRTMRRNQRRFRNASRTITHRRGFREAWQAFQSIEPTDAELFSNRAAAANIMLKRYRAEAQKKLPYRITRTSERLRINPQHRWGPQPFHYRDSDYVSIADSIIETSAHIKLR